MYTESQKEIVKRILAIENEISAKMREYNDTPIHQRYSPTDAARLDAIHALGRERKRLQDSL